MNGAFRNRVAQAITAYIKSLRYIMKLISKIEAMKSNSKWKDSLRTEFSEITTDEVVIYCLVLSTI